MSRLTVNLKKNYDNKYLGNNEKSPYEKDVYLPDNNTTKRQCYDKLGILEDIGEEIGVDLITKDKVEQAHMVYSKQYGKVFIAFWYREYIIIEIDSNRGITTRLLYKDYGKTWALTKEELEGK